ncbi:MAG: glycosyltransferase family 4 protein [Paludibacteraceae bacterium]|nr:glycosyltransferase family 4 protein [Paludibacteraceae bacterium]
MKVLYLTPWYPSKKDEMSGLFVRKHVEAVRAQGVEVRVIFAESWRETGRQWKALRREGWIPDVVQLNVIQKQGLLALWLKKRYGIPYVIVEHWSGYLPENGMFKRLSAIKKRIYRRIAAQAEQVLCVSQRLQQAMQDCGIRAQQWGLIDNVVDGFFSEKVESKKTKVESKKTLLHVSCFDERAKNVKGLLRAAKMLSEKRQDWKLVLVGTGVDYTDVRAFADTLDIPEGLLEWTGELTPREVAEKMHEADALVLSSRYETYGVVLAEAAAAGLPILSTPVGIAENVANLIVPQEIAQNKPGRMAEFMESVLWNQESGVRNQEVRERFSADFIGKKLKKSYDSCLHRDI